MMIKKIITIFFFTLLINCCMALQDYTPSEMGDYEGTVQFDSQTNADISQIRSVVNEIQIKLDHTLQKTDLKTLKTEIDQNFEEKVGLILSYLLVLLLVWTLFFFSLMFILKSKGWI